METIAQIRRANLVQGNSIKAIARELRVSRNVDRNIGARQSDPGAVPERVGLSVVAFGISGGGHGRPSENVTDGAGAEGVAGKTGFESMMHGDGMPFAGIASNADYGTDRFAMTRAPGSEGSFMQLRKTLAAAALGAGLLAGSAQAAIISGTFAVNASGFASGFADFAGSFTLSFDNSADITDSTALTGYTISLGGVPTASFGTIVFSYDQTSDRLNIGGFAGLASNRALSVTASNDFSLRFQPVSGAGGPVFFRLLVGTGSGAEEADIQVGTFTPSDDRVPIPAPPALAVFGLGLLGLGFVRRRGKAPAR